MTALEVTSTSQAEDTETAVVEESEIITPTPEPIHCTLAFDTDRDGN